MTLTDEFMGWVHRYTTFSLIVLLINRKGLSYRDSERGDWTDYHSWRYREKQLKIISNPEVRIPDVQVSNRWQALFVVFSVLSGYKRVTAPLGSP